MVVRFDGETMGPYVYRVENTAKDFLYYIQLMERDIRDDLYKKASIYMTREDWADYNKASKCHICHETLYKNIFLDVVEVYDPDIGEYTELVHRKTNKCYYSNTFKTCIFDEYIEAEIPFPFVGPRNKRLPKERTSPSRICALFVKSHWLGISSEIQSEITVISQVNTAARPTELLILTISESILKG